jgi:hypothetical protein
MGDHIDCDRLASYRGDPSALFAACCPGQPPPQPAAPGATISGCPNLGPATATLKRVSEQAVTCTYAPSPLWAVRDGLTEGSPGRQQACAFLSAAASGTPSGSAALVHLSGESATVPAFLARWRGFAGISATSPPEEDAACESAAAALRPAFERFLAARLRAEAGRLLPGLGSEQRQAGRLYRDHDAWANDWVGQVGRWQAQLRGDLEEAAAALGAARSVALATCFPVGPPGAPRGEHLGAYGRTMAELLTSGLDQAADQLRPERVSAEDPALNAEGAVMCAALPALVLDAMLRRGAQGDPDPDWWRDPAKVQACYPAASAADAARLGSLLGGPDPRVLDAFRLVRGWGTPDSEGAAVCGRRSASLHRALHSLAVFYHGSSFFRVAAGGGEEMDACRMTEAERREPWHRGVAEAAPPACPVGVSSLCGAVQNVMYARPGQLGHGVLRAMAPAELLQGRMLSVGPNPRPADNELNVALARALAAHKQAVCEREQWSGVRTDELGNITESPNFCRRDLSAPWLFSTDPGRGSCGRARAMVEGTPLAGSLDNFPFDRTSPDDPPYCPAPQPGADGTRNDDACCCDTSHYFPPGAEVTQICRLPAGLGASFGSASEARP